MRDYIIGQVSPIRVLGLNGFIVLVNRGSGWSRLLLFLGVMNAVWAFTADGFYKRDADIDPIPRRQGRAIMLLLAACLLAAGWYLAE